MELTGKLKDKVEKAESREEALKAIKDAGIILDDKELDAVAGGMSIWQLPPDSDNRRRKF